MVVDPARVARDMGGTHSFLPVVRKTGPMKVLAGTPAKLGRAVRGLTRTQLLRRPAPAKWSIQEIIAHLADVEIVSAFRYRMIQAQERPPITPFDQDQWADRLHYRRQDLRPALDCFRILRESNLALMRATPRRDWKRIGIHAERGRESFERLVTLMAAHDLNHLAQIARIGRTLG